MTVSTGSLLCLSINIYTTRHTINHWVSLLLDIRICNATKIDAKTGCSPFKVFYGRSSNHEKNMELIDESEVRISLLSYIGV